MTKREIIGAIVIAVVVGLLGVFGGKVMGTYDRGSQATVEDQVGVILDEKLNVVIGGEDKTLGQAISLLNENQIDTNRRLANVEGALRAFTAQPGTE